MFFYSLKEKIYEKVSEVPGQVSKTTDGNHGDCPRLNKNSFYVFLSDVKGVCLSPCVH